MRKLLLLSVLALLVVSCDSYSSYECKKSVERSFPEAISIIQPAGEPYRWIVMDKDSFIYYVETMTPFSTSITQRELIFKHK